MSLSPGAYLKRRREEAGLTIADVAEHLATEPRIAEQARAEWIALIEADQAPASFRTISALSYIFLVDLDVLARLQVISLGLDILPPRLCRVCACSDRAPCSDGAVCTWVADDLCSNCVGRADAAARRVAA